jgi:hypothetical protein
MPRRPVTPIPHCEPEPELDRPTLASPPPDFGLDDPTAEHPFPFDLRFADPLDPAEFDLDDDRPTPVDDIAHLEAERPRRDTDPAPPPDGEEQS